MSKSRKRSGAAITREEARARKEAAQQKLEVARRKFNRIRYKTYTVDSSGNIQDTIPRPSFDLGWRFVKGEPSRRYEARDFTLQGLKKLSVAEKRKLYSRFRSAANKRRARLEEGGFSESEYFKKQDSFAKLSEISDEDLDYELRNAYYFLTTHRSTLEYQRALKEINVLSIEVQRWSNVAAYGEDIYPDITDDENYWDYFRLMNQIKQRIEDSLYDSEQAAIVAGELIRRRLPLEALFPSELTKGNEAERKELAELQQSIFRAGAAKDNPEEFNAALNTLEKRYKAKKNRTSADVRKMSRDVGEKL